MISSRVFALLRFISVDLNVTTLPQHTDTLKQLAAKSPHSIIKLNLATLMRTKLSGDTWHSTYLNDMLHSIMLLWRTRSAPSCGSLRVSCGTSV